MNIICIRKNTCSKGKNNLLFLPSNMAAVQNLYTGDLPRLSWTRIGKNDHRVISVLIMIVSVWGWNPPLLKSSSVISCHADHHASLKSLGKSFVQRHVWSVNVILQSALTLNLSRMWETIFLGHRQLKPGLGRAPRNFLTTFHEFDRQTATWLRLPMQFMRNSVGLFLVPLSTIRLMISSPVKTVFFLICRLLTLIFFRCYDRWNHHLKHCSNVFVNVTSISDQKSDRKCILVLTATHWISLRIKLQKASRKWMIRCEKKT